MCHTEDQGHPRDDAVKLDCKVRRISASGLRGGNRVPVEVLCNDVGRAAFILEAKYCYI